MALAFGAYIWRCAECDRAQQGKLSSSTPIDKLVAAVAQGYESTADMNNHEKAVQAILTLRSGKPAQVDFVAPIVSTMLAAETINGIGSQVSFVAGSERYAKGVGLTDVLEGREPARASGGLVGRTYSPLAKLSRHEDVNSASDTVAACLDQQLGGGRYKATVNEISRVIGELHDNVASHAQGAGFSSLQVYQNGSGVEFAVADAGVGLLTNVRPLVPSVSTHAAAIHWCFQRGNTTAPTQADGFAQMLPDDAPNNPYGARVATRSNENNHLGEGLWQLLNLVRELDGQLWVLTGNAELYLAPASPRGHYAKSALDWRGLAIEVILPVAKVYVAKPEVGDESVARRFGI